MTVVCGIGKRMASIFSYLERDGFYIKSYSNAKHTRNLTISLTYVRMIKKTYVPIFMYYFQSKTCFLLEYGLMTCNIGNNQFITKV